MRQPRDWSAGAKILAVSAAMMLLSLGLCAVLGTWDSVGATRRSEQAILVGQFLFWLALAGFAVGLLLTPSKWRKR